jgi:DNA-binding protein HU-beta
VTKSELVAVVATRTGVSKVTVENVLYQALGTSSKELRAGRKVTLTGFGVFCVTVRKAHVGVNPKTRETVEVPEKRAVAFRASGKLKKLVENK